MMINSKFEIVYKMINEELNNSKIIQEGIAGKIGKTLATGAIAAASMLSPMNADAREINNDNQHAKVEVQSAEPLLNYTERLLKQFESFVKDSKGNHIAYDDFTKKKWNGKQDIDKFIKSCKGKATIGYGETDLDVVRKGTISEQEANTLLRNHIISINNKLVQKFEKAYSNLNTVQKAALISFYYNLGIYFKAPKMEANLRAGKLKEAAREFLDCDNQRINGKLEKRPGLTKRRKIEHNLFIQSLK